MLSEWRRALLVFSIYFSPTLNMYTHIRACLLKTLFKRLSLFIYLLCQICVHTYGHVSFLKLFSDLYLLLAFSVVTKHGLTGGIT
jgi:hypothetical protein